MICLGWCSLLLLVYVGQVAKRGMQGCLSYVSVLFRFNHQVIIEIWPLKPVFHLLLLSESTSLSHFRE